MCRGKRSRRRRRPCKPPRYWIDTYAQGTCTRCGKPLRWNLPLLVQSTVKNFINGIDNVVSGFSSLLNTLANDINFLTL